MAGSKQAQGPQFDPTTEQDTTVEDVQLTREMLSAQHRVAAKAKLCQGLTPEVTEGKARVGQWLVEGVPQQFSSLTFITGLPKWKETDEGSVYTYTGLADSGTDETGASIPLHKVVSIRFQKSGLQAAQQVNNLIFEQPDQEQVAVTLGAKFIKGKKGSWYTVTVEPADYTAEMEEAYLAAGL